MAVAETPQESGAGNDGETETEEREEFAWLNVSPDTTLVGTPVDLIYSGQLGTSDEEAQNDTSFGVVFENLRVEDGELFENSAKEDGITIVENEYGDEKHQTDYRVVDPEDADATIVNGQFNAGKGVFVESDGITEEKVIVWYNGMTGQAVGRALDFNGLPWARYTGDEGYLIKGLFQCAEGWRENRSQRGEMAKNGFAPRVVRAPLLREDLPEEVAVRIKRSPNNPRMYWADVFSWGADDLEAHYDGEYLDDEHEIEWNYSAEADDVLDEVEYAMHMYHGTGWPDEPENIPNVNTDSSSTQSSEDNAFDGLIEVETPEHLEDLEPVERQFVQQVSVKFEEAGMTPDGGTLANVIEQQKVRSQFDEADVSPDLSAIKEAIEAEMGL